MRPGLLMICSVCTPSSSVSRLRGSGTSWMPLSAASAATIASCGSREDSTSLATGAK
jgi:hypothetical protein